MTNSQTRVEELLATPEGQRGFLEWLGSDLTQLLIAASRERARPYVSAQESSDLSLGRSIGANEVLDYMILPMGRHEKDTQLNKLKPTYGSEKILAQVFPTVTRQ